MLSVAVVELLVKSANVRGGDRVHLSVGRGWGLGSSYVVVVVVVVVVVIVVVVVVVVRVRRGKSHEWVALNSWIVAVQLYPNPEIVKSLQ